MRIDTIELKNFRGFESYRRDFNAEVNVIVGENGTGKTALLKAIALGVGAFLLAFGDKSVRKIELDDAHRIPEDSSDGAATVPVYPVELKFEGNVFNKPLRWEREFRNGNSVRALKLKKAVEEHTQPRRDPPETWPLIAYHGTERRWVQMRSNASVETKGSQPRRSAYANCLAAASDEKRFLDWFKAMEWVAFQEKKEPVALRVVRVALQALVPGCVDLRYRSKEGELVALFDDGRRLPNSMLSDGFAAMLGVTADLAWRCAVLNPHLGERATQETPGVVLIDEIDLHLHPNWQRRVVGDLRRIFPKVQFFLTTHSPFIVQSLRAGEVVALSGPAHLDKAPFKQGVEEVAEGVLGVTDVARSERFREMEEVARSFIAVLEQAEGRSTPALDEARRRYLALVTRYADDPAFAATLKVEAALRGIRLYDAKPEVRR
jgi:predicted ATP-binding protein involved in virulence